MEALRLFTVGSSWFSSEEGQKGAIVPGQLADLAVLSADYFSVPDEQIKDLESVPTLVGGRVVYGAGAFTQLAPPPRPVSPDWSPVATYGGYAPHAAGTGPFPRPLQAYARAGAVHAHAPRVGTWAREAAGLWSLRCDCFA
jgi:hypothetical protein